MRIGELVVSLKELLAFENFEADSSLNGLQVGDEDRDISKVAFAVDACQSSIDQAISQGADLLIVHHGLFWGKPLSITGSHYNRVKTMLDNNLALFACHIPLDAHPELGNNAQMAKILGLKVIEPFCSYHGMSIGFKGVLPYPMTNSQIIEKLGIRTDLHNVVIDGGSLQNTTVGIVSGSAAYDVSDAIDQGLDVYVTGESSHAVYHDCIEKKINMLCLGHYETETFGVKALQSYIEDNYGLETCFIDIPTGI